MTDELIGTELGGFTIVRRLGAGAMGVVYEAIDQSLRRTVALKLLPEALTQDRDRRQRFLREARAAAAVTHPNVATIYSVGQVAQPGAAGEAERVRVFIAMELVVGMTLRAHLAAGPLPIAELVRIALAIARGLARAHEVGVVHRDIKPDNIMIGPERQPKILDFGLARRLELDVPAGAEPSGDLTAEGRMLGTPGYMAPEQGRGVPVDARADVFSFGVVLYEMLAGVRPFTGPTPLDAVIAAARDAHVPVGDKRADVPPELAAIVDRALAKVADDRYADGAALVAALQHLTDTTSAPITAPSLERRAAPLRSRRTAYVLGAAGVGAMAGVIALASGGAGAAADLDAPDAVIACPILEASGVDEPSQWLGAAAAHLACERLTVLLGGRDERTRVPAELLDLPGAPGDGQPVDPFAGPEQRGKTLMAARARGAGWLDGHVSATNNGFAVELRLETADGTEAGPAHGEARALNVAVAAALDRLFGHGAMPLPGRLDPALARWRGSDDVQLALAEVDLWHGLLSGATEGPFAVLTARKAELGPRWAMWQSMIDRVTDRPPFEFEIPAPADPASREGRVALAHGRAFGDPKTDLTAAADEVAGMRHAGDDPVARGILSSVEAEIRHHAGDNSRAAQVALALAAEMPRRVNWGVALASATNLPSFESIVYATIAWNPYVPDGWALAGLDPRDPVRSERMSQRAILLGASSPAMGVAYAVSLLRRGQSAKVRAIAARLAIGTAVEARAAELLSAMLDVADAKFGAAEKRLRALIASRRTIGRYGAADYTMVLCALSLGVIRGAPQPLADELARTYVLATPHRLARDPQTPIIFANVCTWASAPVAEACIATLRRLMAERYFPGRFATTEVFLEAALRFAKGDMAGAAEAWRPMLGSQAMAPFSGRAFDAIGEPETASLVDAGYMHSGQLWHGASMAHAREARRALARNDLAACRDNAQKIITAWEVADIKVPVVAEMRELLARCTVAQEP